MALRLIQLFLPHSEEETLQKILEGRDVLGRWNDSSQERLFVNLLVPVDETEAIMDRFEQHFGKKPGFHVVLSAIEAAIPRVEVEEENKDGENGKQSATDEEEQRSQDRVSREELYMQVTDGLGVTRVFVGMSLLSAVVAAVGLLKDDVAVIIGAMVIAPLLGPNVAMSLATTLGDFKLLRRALWTNIVGVSLAFGLSLVIGYLFEVNAEIPAIAGRSQVGIGDILLALAAGSAGTLAVTRGLSGAVIGVMVAVALVPPLVACGMLFGEGLFWQGFQAALLTGTNVICINLAGVATFIVQGIRPRRWWEAERAKRAIWQTVGLWVFLLAALSAFLYLSGKKG